MAREGQTLKEIVKSCEAGTCCGACAVDLRDLVRSETEKPKPQAKHNNDC
jgi:bacterioferritin-associated ferredoxin